MGNHQ